MKVDVFYTEERDYRATIDVPMDDVLEWLAEGGSGKIVDPADLEVDDVRRYLDAGDIEAWYLDAKTQSREMGDEPHVHMWGAEWNPR